MDRRTALLALVLPLSALAQTPKPAPGVVGAWTAKRPVHGLKMQYTFNAKGEYLALLEEMDHQGDYIVKGDRVILLPNVVHQRPVAQFLKELQRNPDGDPKDLLAFERLIAKPYSLKLSPDHKTLTGLGFSVRLDPKAKPLF